MAEKQHKKPCHDCPFTTKAAPGETGGSHPAVYVMQTILPYRIPCHCRIDYSDPNWKKNDSTPECVGHAIMRVKQGVADKMPEALLRIEPYEGDQVFNNLIEMFCYHTGSTEDEAKAYLELALPQMIIEQTSSESFRIIDQNLLNKLDETNDEL
jgi:hypothetical protein